MCPPHQKSRTPDRQELDASVDHIQDPFYLLFFIVPIKFYRRYLSPLKPPTCRFTPTCSQYALDSYRNFGVILGTWRTLTRLLRCHPWHPGGYDPVKPHEKTDA